jgi:glutathione S-transferase
MATQTGQKPTLWQIDISHYSEKVRWALDYKEIDHARRAPLPGTHIPIAFVLTRGEQITFPVLTMDGRTIGDSTAIIAALEAKHLDRPLYPSKPEHRARALELEEFFDEELGPYTRFLAFHELVNEPEIFTEVASRAVPGLLGEVKPLVGAYARAFTSVRWGARDEGAAVTAREKIVIALDRLESELEAEDGDHLVGDSFTVADLTAASLFYPLVLPPEGPTPPDTPQPPALERFRESLSDRPGFRWVQETFRRHRHG